MTSRQACNTRLERRNRMLEGLEPTKEPAWTISHEGYNVLGRRERVCHQA
jgi:hypothetical protein